MKTVWPYDAVAEFYDDDMGRNTDGRDVDYYRDRCLAIDAAATAGVLELGCGTGRITFALAEAGLRVTGIDRSAPMLRVLRRKLAARRSTSSPWRTPRVVAMDMARPALVARFGVVLCPFSAFTYLVDNADRAAALDFVRHTLAPGGRFILDVFIPDPNAESIDMETFDYRRLCADGTWLERYRTITPDVPRPGVNRIQRRYASRVAGGVIRWSVVTESFQHAYPPDELLNVLRGAGFSVVSSSADFVGAPIANDARTLVVEAETARKTFTP